MPASPAACAERLLQRPVSDHGGIEVEVILSQRRDHIDEPVRALPWIEMAHENDARPPVPATDVGREVDRVPGVGDDHKTILGNVVELVGLLGHVAGHRGDDVGPSGVVAVEGPIRLPLKRPMGSADLQIHEGQVAREGDSGVLGRLASVGHDHRRSDPLHLAAEPPDHSRIKAETAEQPAWHIELDIRSKQHRIGPEQSQDLVRLAFGVEGVDKGSGIALGASRQVIREYVENDGRSRGARHLGQ